MCQHVGISSAYAVQSAVIMFRVPRLVAAIQISVSAAKDAF